MFSLGDERIPILAPWLSLTLGERGPSWCPGTTLETSAALRALADDLDRAWEAYRASTGPRQPVTPFLAE